MFRRFLLVCLLITSATFAHTQVQQTSLLPKAENTYALVIGISRYEIKSLSLNYAHRDAEAFAGYLQSEAGGTIPADNIRLLLDSNATTAAIYNSLRWLKKKVEVATLSEASGKCMVYIYFSGHGDVETNTRANLGFLLAYNTPRNNYINNAVRIEDLNDYAHTLSADLNANVVLITDACHSGTLAGRDYRGSYLAGTALSKARDQEIRIASCKPEELSKEDERWGNGRGVFSWYLVNGLKGLADGNSDKLVTLTEAQRYVDSAIAADAILREMNHKQTPVLRGNPQFKLAAVNEAIRDSIQRVMPAPVVMLTGPMDLTPGLVRQHIDHAGLTFLDRLNNEPAEKIPVSFLSTMLEDEYYIEEEKQSLRVKIEQVKTDSAARKAFADFLTEQLHAKGQEAINAYLAGDVAELERRRYYNSREKGYDKYTAMFNVALKLTEPDDPMYHILKVNSLYFTGIAMRMKMPLVNTDTARQLETQAIVIQLQALAMDDNAAYIHNELGVLYLGRNKLDSAEQYFINAAELAPSWAIPQSNLCGLYLAKGDMEKAAAAGQEADRLQPGSHLTQVALGALEEKRGNGLFAEENYRQAIALNSRHYFPFERLGFVYLSNTQYALADSFFHEADLRKRGYNFSGNESKMVATPILPVAASPYICLLDTAKLLKEDVMGYFYWAMQAYTVKNYPLAERVFRRLVAYDTTNPLAFHYLAKMYYDQKHWEKAELMFKLAYRYYLDVDRFNRYCDSLLQGKRFPYTHECFERYFRESHYGRMEDYYFLARLYAQWDHYEEADTWYGNIINDDPTKINGYLLRWQQQEKREDYSAAEKTIRSFAVHDAERADLEMNEFYRRLIAKFPDNPEWPYRLSLLLYERAMRPSMAPMIDTIIWFPKEGREIHIDPDNYYSLGSRLKWDINDGINPPMLNLVPVNYSGGNVTLPGVNEAYDLADPIITPRKDAIYYLRLADSLQPEPLVKAEINFKTGNVLLRAGSPTQAYPCYARSVELSPDNASARMRLVDVSEIIYKHRKGFEQLTYLYDSARISFPHRLLYADWSLRAGKPSLARRVIAEAAAIYPYPLPQAGEITARSWLAEKEYAKAITLYKALSVKEKNNAFLLYTLARLYALSGNKTEAWKMLDAAILKGFNYKYVLNADMALQSLHGQPQWAALLNKVKEKQYFEPPQ